MATNAHRQALCESLPVRFLFVAIPLRLVLFSSHRPDRKVSVTRDFFGKLPENRHILQI